MNLQLQSDEIILKEGLANHFKGIEAVGGKLFLTNKRVCFISHTFNIQVHQLSIPINQIHNIGKRNTLLFVPNGLFIELKSGFKEKFVLYRRSTWISMITEQMKKTEES